jgi:hypothetical protein
VDAEVSQASARKFARSNPDGLRVRALCYYRTRSVVPLCVVVSGVSLCCQDRNTLTEPLELLQEPHPARLLSAPLFPLTTGLHRVRGNSGRERAHLHDLLAVAAVI